MATNKLKFTDKALKAIPAHSGTGNETLYWDTHTKGLILAAGKQRKTFHVRSTVKGKRTPSGHPFYRRIALGTYGDAPGDITLDQARANASTLIGQMRSGIDPVAERIEREQAEQVQAESVKASNVTLRDVYNDYLESSSLRKWTKHGYKYVVEHNMAEYLDKPIASITSDDLLAVRKAIKKQCQKDNHADEFAGNGAANLTFRVMKAIFSHAMDMKNPPITVNPLQPTNRKRNPFKQLPMRSRTDQYIEASELAAFHQAIIALGETHKHEGKTYRGDPTLRDYFLLLLFTGFRRNEGAALDWSEIDFTRNTITLPEERAKNMKKFVIPMSDYLREVLHRRWEEAGKPSSGWVFEAHSKSGHVEEPRAYLERALARAGITRTITIHDLRRTFNNTGRRAGVDSDLVRVLLNHTPSASDTKARSYDLDYRNKPDESRPYVQQIADRLKRECGIGQAGKVVELKQRA